LGSAIINERYLCDNISLAAWEWEIVVQDMHLTFGEAHFVGVEAEAVAIPALSGFDEDPATPVSCFCGENLEAWLDSEFSSQVSRPLDSWVILPVKQE